MVEAEAPDTVPLPHYRFEDIGSKEYPAITMHRTEERDL
jgi:hypothetical protein